VRAWWALGIVAFLYLAVRGFGMVRLVALPLILALFPAAVLLPVVRRLEARRCPRALASALVVLVGAAASVMVGFLVGPALAGGMGDIGADLAEAEQSVRQWLVDGPFGLSSEQVQSYRDRLVSTVTEDGASTLLGGLGVAAELLAGAALTAVFTFFYLKDGDRLVHHAVERLPGHDGRIEDAFRAGRHTLGRYIGGLALTGLFDAIVIGIGLLIIGVPLVLPLAVLIFFGAFFPIIGAWLTGLLAVAVALVNGGLTDALLAMALITVVQQLEGDIVLPLIFGKVLTLHPVVVLVGVIGGGAAFGVAGAFLTVPAIAVVVAVRAVMRDESSPSPSDADDDAHQEPEGDAEGTHAP
jgi:putative heme transporter